MNRVPAVEPVRRRSIVQEAATFIALGVSSYAIGAGLSAFLREVIKAPAEVAVGVSLLVLVFYNFWGNRLFVFRGTGPVGQEFLKYLPASVAARGLEYGLILLLLHWQGLNYLLAYTLALLISNGFKFIFYRTFVFRRQTLKTR